MPVTRDFVIAGDAIFTIETPDNKHYTFRVSKVAANDRWSDSWFVKMLTGPDNTSDYTYVGKLDYYTGQVLMTTRSKLSNDSYPMKLLNRVLARVWNDDHSAYEAHGYKTHHEGRCGRCGRLLTVPSSVQSGIGPECSRIMARA